MRHLKSVIPLIIILAWPLVGGPYGRGAMAGSQDLEARARERFKRLPASMAAGSNPITPDKVRLGKMLFYEDRISVDGTVSCARCHPFSLYAADGLRTPVGNRCSANARNAPTVLNAAGQIAEHWIGNRADVEDQALQSLTGAASFGMPSPADALKALRAIPGYGPLFGKAFPGEPDPVTLENFAKAVGAFERTLVTPSPFDAFLAGNAAALSAGEKEGLKTFLDRGCVSCHSGTFVGGGMYAKFGIASPYWEATKSEKPDAGRFEVTKNEADRYVFKVPGLRNAARTAPYFHDGSVESLETAVGIMAKVQLGLDLPAGDRGAITAFLGSLTGKIPEDALLVPERPVTVRAEDL